MKYTLFSSVLVLVISLSSALAGAAQSSSCRFYLAQTLNTPSAELEVLARNYGLAEPQAQKRIEERVIGGALREILFMAKKRARTNPSMQMDDLVQSGLMNVRVALQKYDATKGKFFPYLVTWVNAGMMEAIEKNYGQMGVFSKSQFGPPYFYRRARVMTQIESRGQEATPQRIADTYNQLFPRGIRATPAMVEVQEEFFARRFSISLDQPDGFGSPVGDHFTSDSRDPEGEAAFREEMTALTQLVEEFLDQLKPPLEKRIFLERVLPSLADRSETVPTLAFLGGEFGLSNERVRQIQVRIERQFKYFLKKKNLKVPRGDSGSML